MNAPATSGSPIWQTVFLSFAAVLPLFEIARGYRQGLPRQLVRLLALVAAYAAAWFGGALFLPWLRPLGFPDFVLSPISSALLALVVYNLINLIGRFVFMRTAKHEVASTRLLYGVGGGFFGAVFGLFFIWLLLVGLRSAGSVADAQLHARVTDQPPLALRADSPSRAQVPAASDPTALATLFARLKNYVELGTVGALVKQSDVLPAGAYQTLGQLGETLARPGTAQRLAEDPAIRELADNPKIVALRGNPEIARLVEEGRYFDLLRDPRLVAAFNDPALIAALKRFDLKRALFHANAKP